MRSLALPGDEASPLQILCLGAHSDDIEIGCGGTILRLGMERPSCVFQWLVFSATGVRDTEARHAAALFVAPNCLRPPIVKSFSDGSLPFVGAEVRAVFEELKQSITPDIIFTHNRSDAHQDHRLIAELTWHTFRDHTILEYEIPKYDGDLGQPSVFVPLSAEISSDKIRHLMNAFPSQHSRRWFREDIFLSLMRLRGMECNAPSGYAEAFFCRKLVI